MNCHQIPGFGILAIFGMALLLIVGNETAVSSVSELLSTVTTTESSAVPQSTSAAPTSKVPKCLVNVHIPKVGGRTVGTFLQQVVNVTGFERYPLYGHKNEDIWEDVVSAKRELILGKGDDGFADGTHQDYLQNVFVQGHFTARIFDLYPELKECLIMTVLRQPVDRAISAFFFHNHQRSEIDKCLWPENYNPNNETETENGEEGAIPAGQEESRGGFVLQRGNNTSILPTITVDKKGAKMQLARARIKTARRTGGYGKGRCRLFWQYSNDMTFRFAGLPELPWKSWEMNHNRRSRDQLHRGLHHQPRFNVSSIPKMNETHLARAMENMKNTLGLVCFLHDLPSCAQRIVEAFQLDASELDLSIMSTNKTTRYRTQNRPDDLEEEEVQKFQEANRLDQELYDWALERYS